MKHDLPLRAAAAEPATDAEGKAGGRRPGKRRDARWKQILEAAAIEFHEKGYGAASLQDIASRVGILKGSIYYYIKTKQDMLEALLVQVHADGLAMVRESIQADGNAVERLARLTRAYPAFIVENPISSAVYLHEVQRLRREDRIRILKDHALRNEVEAVLVEGQRQGLIRPELDPKLTAQTMLSGLNSIYQWYRASPSRPLSTLLDHLTSTTLGGVVTKAGMAFLA